MLRYVKRTLCSQKEKKKDGVIVQQQQFHQDKEA